MDLFTKGFCPSTYAGETIAADHDGWHFVAFIEHDSDTTPFDDGESRFVSEWTSRAKRPGELVLHSDRGSKRFFDYEEACQVARDQKWGTYRHFGPWRRQRQVAALAALDHYETMRSWCADEWFYCGVVVNVWRINEDDDYTTEPLGDASVWGIEANYPGSDNSYLSEVAREQAHEALGHARWQLGNEICEDDPGWEEARAWHMSRHTGRPCLALLEAALDKYLAVVS